MGAGLAGPPSHSTKALFCSTIASYAPSRLHRSSGVRFWVCLLCWLWLVFLVVVCVRLLYKIHQTIANQQTARGWMWWTPLRGSQQLVKTQNPSTTSQNSGFSIYLLRMLGPTPAEIGPRVRSTRQWATKSSKSGTVRAVKMEFHYKCLNIRDQKSGTIIYNFQFPASQAGS